MNNFKSLQQEKENLTRRIDEEQTALTTLNNSLEELEINHDLLKYEDSIHRLQQSTNSIHSALQDSAKVQIEREDMEIQISEEIKSIDRKWDEEILLEFDLTEAEKDQIDQFAEDFEVLRKVQKIPDASQRELAEELGFSLGKLNYCLNALKEKGLIKIDNFKKNPNKLGYIYVLTPKGISTKTKLTLSFMKRKIQEYDELKKEID